jgi:hypothetical protein
MKPRYAGDDGDHFGLADLVWLLLIAIVIGSAGAESCRADEPPKPGVRWSTSAGYETLIRRGEDRKFSVFARAQVDVPLSSVHAFARLDKSAIVTERPELTSLATAQFDTLEVTLGAYRPVGPIHAALVYTYAVPLQAGKVERYPATYGAGVFIGAPYRGRWVFLGAGQDDVLGGAAALGAWQLPIDGRLISVGKVKAASVKSAQVWAGFTVGVGR